MAKRTEQTQQSIAERVNAIVDEVLIGTSHFRVDVEVRGHWGTRVVEVFVDSDDPLGLDDLAVISREIEFVLDVEDVIDGSYKLQVSTPGVDRPLASPRQYRKNVGKTLRVHYNTEPGDSEKAEGELVEADEEAIELVLNGGQRQRIRYPDIEEAVVQLPW